MPVGKRNDPFGGFNYRVEIDGLTVGGFSEVSGLQVEVEVEDYREGGVNAYLHRIPGPTRYPNNLVLKHGLTDTTELWDWHHDVTQGTITRRQLTITLQDNAGDDVCQWIVNEACPVRWVGPELRASTAEIAVETLELVHRGISK